MILFTPLFFGLLTKMYAMVFFIVETLFHNESTCQYIVKLTHAVTCIKRSHFSCPVIIIFL
jgi:hypothetical protein